MGRPWNLVSMDVGIDYDAFERARERAIADGRGTDYLTVEAEVDLDEALEEASVEQLRAALEREASLFTHEQLDAIRDCFAAVGRGDTSTALALINRIFEHRAEIAAAEAGILAGATRRAA